MKINVKKGFTLIELLVVIAIIGILSTGAIWIYTSQLQKARDTTRITGINELRWAIEQYYQDGSEYPTTSSIVKGNSSDDSKTYVSTFLQKIPEDPKNWQWCAKGKTSTQPVCALAYIVWDDENGITNWAYELSTAFENAGNTNGKAANTEDSWNDDARYEHFVWKKDLDTAVSKKITGSNSYSLLTTDSTSVVIILKNWVAAWK